MRPSASEVSQAPERSFFGRRWRIDKPPNQPNAAQEKCFTSCICFHPRSPFVPRPFVPRTDAVRRFRLSANPTVPQLTFGEPVFSSKRLRIPTPRRQIEPPSSAMSGRVAACRSRTGLPSIFAPTDNTHSADSTYTQCAVTRVQNGWERFHAL
jgi:hypothetical protein